jgi:hypothetical protein
MPTQGTAGGRVPYAPPPKITVTPPTFTLGRNEAFRRLVIVLDVHEGRLWAEDWREGRDFHDTKLPAYYPDRDLYFVGGSAHDWFTRGARRLGWSPGHYPSFPGDADTFQADLDVMARWARELVDNLAPLPDGGYDWTLKATAAYERIGYLTSYGTRGLLGDDTDPTDPWHGDGSAPLPDRHHYGVVSFEEVLAASPAGWADPLWVLLGDAELDLVAESLVNRYRAHHVPEQFRARLEFSAEAKLRATIRFHKQRRDDQTLAEENQGVPIHVIGARIGLRRHRAARIADQTQLPARHAAEYLTEHPEAFPETLRAASSDGELEHIAKLVDATAAAEHGVALVATAGVLRAARAERRRLTRAELQATGDAYTHAALELRQMGDRRAALLLEVASFQEEPEWDSEKGEPRYAELARLARMTRQAARERITAGEALPAVPDDDVAAAIRDYLRTRQNAQSAAQLAAMLAERDLEVPREQLDRVLAAMHRADDVRRLGHVGPEYALPR